ncbi:MAG TPA: TIGR02281 family clan AA aspartic protease [Usitatibacter sp.]|nr:TIGR02281 family clan AA aspartic protease [Usitatibacter sp.]
MKSCSWIAALALAFPAGATDVTVVGLFSGKAVVTVNRGQPRILAVGQATAEGVKLVAVDARGATLEIDGKRQVLEMGQHFELSSQPVERSSVTLAPDARGHFLTDGQVNGGHVRFLVDTGATTIRLSTDDARRLGIDFRTGAPGYSILADGSRVPAYRVKLDTVALGGLVLYNVDATVGEGGGVALLGMSFLNRTEMRREGQNLVLTKRY